MQVMLLQEFSQRTILPVQVKPHCMKLFPATAAAVPALFAIFAILLTSCSASKKTEKPRSTSNGDHPVSRNAFLFAQRTTDSTYGYSEKNPVRVGNADASEGPLNEQRFLNALLGPHGERIAYVREGSCCPFETNNGFMGGGMLDRYKITWAGQDQPVILYLNMYDPGDLFVPVGFTVRNDL